MSSAGNILNNRYRLERKLGAGGFAEVFLATDLELGRQVAIKVLDQTWAKDKEFLARFRNEARAVARLDHPNILLIHDFGVAKGVPFLVMPYISGGTFADRMKQGRLTLDEVGFYLDQIGFALDHAHQHGIVHRDVKPTNLLMRPDGRLVLMDFGLAKLLENASVEAQTGVLGTAAYMAPEQFQGLVSAASDIYVLGVIFYQMIAGSLPYEGNTHEMLVGHAYKMPQALTGHPAMQGIHPVITQALDEVILKVLAKNPADRYPTCQALSTAYYQARNAHKGAMAGSSGKSTPAGFDETFPPDRSFLVSPVNRALGPALANSPEKIKERIALKLSLTPEGSADETLITQPMLEGDGTLIAPPAPQPVAAGLGLQRKKVMLKPAQITVTTEPDQGFRTIFMLTEDVVTLGRATDNTFCLPLSIISRYHAAFHRINPAQPEPQYKIVECKTANRLRYKGSAVQEQALENGDVIEIGERGYAAYIVKLTYSAPLFGFEEASPGH